MIKSKKRLIIAIICGVLAAAAMAFYATGITAEAKQGRQAALSEYGGAQVEVFVATRDIAVGESLSADNCSLQLCLSDMLPAGALSEQKQVFGQTAIIPMMKNEAVVSAKLGELKAPVTVPDGTSAVSIPSDDVLAVGGAIHPGAYVTIYSSNGTEVLLLAEEVLVLDTNNSQVSDPGTNGMLGSAHSRESLTWVTLAVEPDSVQELIAASGSEQLHLVLPGGVLSE